ncbi:hypothetical protein LSAT2_023593 [Lamellibrachia satsuma]|nr:hypothetical protein LSAT2_023593 [Lamellibrachia satsuma]
MKLGTEAGGMQRCDVGVTRMSDGRPRVVQQGAWCDGLVDPSVENQHGSGPAQHRSRVPIYRMAFNKQKGGGCESSAAETGVMKNEDNLKLLQNGDTAMHLESFNDDDGNGTDNDDCVQQTTMQCQDNSLPMISTPATIQDCENNGTTDNDAMPGLSKLSAVKTACNGGWCEEEMTADVTLSRKRRSLLQRASKLWRSTSKNDVWEFKKEVSVGDDDDASTKKSFGLFKKAALKLVAVKRFEEGVQGKDGVEERERDGIWHSKSTNNIDTDTNIIIPGTPKKRTFGLFKKATLKLSAVKGFEEGARGNEGEKMGTGVGGHTTSRNNVQESDTDTNIVFPDTPKKKSFGLFKKAPLKVRAVKRFEEPTWENGKTKGNAGVGKRAGTCCNGVGELDGDVSDVAPHPWTKKSFSLFKKAALKVTATKRFEGMASGKKNGEEGVVECKGEETEERDDSSVSPSEQGPGLSHDGTHLDLLDLDEDCMDEDYMDDDRVQSLNSSGIGGLCKQLPAETRNTTVIAWGTDCDNDANSVKSVSLSSYDGCNLNGANSKGTPCTTGDTGMSSADGKLKKKSTSKAQGKFRKAFTFLKAMNGFGGGSKTNVSSTVEKEGKVVEVRDSGVVSPSVSEVVSRDPQDWDSDSSSEEDTVQSAGVKNNCRVGNMYASNVELSSDDNSSQSGVVDMSVCAQSQDISSVVSEGDSVSNMHQQHGAIVRTEEETTRNTTAIAWGSGGHNDTDSDNNVSLSSHDECTMNGVDSKGTVCSTGEIGMPSAEGKPKGKSTLKKDKHARGTFRKAFTFLKAMNGFGGGSKTNVSSTVEKESKVAEVRDSGVVSPSVSVSEVVSRDLQDWDSNMSSEEDMGQPTGVKDTRRVSNMYASNVEVSSDNSSSQSEVVDMSVCAQSQDISSVVSEGGSVSNMHQRHSASDIAEEEEPVNEAAESDTIMLEESLIKPNGGKQKLKKAFLTAKIASLFKNKSGSTKMLASHSPEDNGSVVDSDHQVGLSDRSDLESARSSSAACSGGDLDVMETDKLKECIPQEMNNKVSDVDTVSGSDISQQAQRKHSTCHTPVTSGRRHMTPDHDDMSVLSGSDASELLLKPCLSVPASPSQGIDVDKSAATASKVKKKWKLFSKNKNNFKKLRDLAMPDVTTGQLALDVEDGGHLSDMSTDRHVLPHGGHCQDTSASSVMEHCDVCDRLEAELEEARRKHEEEMRVELERQETEAQLRMDEELEKKTREANQQLNQQRNLYEDRLAQLNQLLKVRDQKEHESDQYRQEAESLVEKLERQKERLEKEVLANRKRLERETKASLKSVEVSRFSHSKIVEQLEREKQKIQRDVERLEQLRSRRGTPCCTPISTPRPMSSGGSSKTDLYRVALLLREANRITQFLKKDTSFTREDIMSEDNGPTQTLVKVTNTKLGVSTFWTMEKFEDRLVRMRELYQGEADGSPAPAEDDVFYDSNDAWEKDDRIGSSPMISPRLINSLGRPEMSSLTMRLSFSPAPVKASPALRKSDAVDTADTSITNSETDTTNLVDGSTAAPSAVFGLCRTLISTVLDCYKDAGCQPESSADRLLQCCQAVKVTVTDILDAYNQATEGDCTNKGVFQNSTDIQSKCVQLVCSLNLLLSHNALWTASFTHVTSTLITDLCERMAATVRKLGHHMALLLQGCENDIDNMVQTSASQILECVFEVCRHCGELSIATETSMSSLRDLSSTKGTMLHTDIRQHFQSGTDTFIDKTLHGALKTAEECITKAVTISDDFHSDSTGGTTGDILSHVDQTTASARVLLQKLQNIQVQLDGTLLDSGTAEGRSPDFYHHNYLRCQSLVTDVGNLVDGISLLVQVSEPIGRGDNTGLRRLLRCVEMVQKSSTRILIMSSSSPENDASVNIALTDMSTMSDSQIEQIDFAVQEVKLATVSLNALIKRQLEKEGLLTPGKSKRVLPLSPRRGNTRLKSPTVKQNSAGSARNLCLVDLAEY